MPSAYLTTSQAGAYGLTNPTTAQIQAASSLLDAYLKRSEGLVWTPDAQGLPCFMAALTAIYSFTLSAPISAGVNVSVQLPPSAFMLSPGDVLVLDRQSSSPNVSEACVIGTMSGPPTALVATLQSVINAHGADATAEAGLVIEEKRQMPADRPITFTSRTPLMRIHSGTGRYGYGRRGYGDDYNMEQFNLLAALSKFGGPPVWELWNPPTPNNWDQTTGQVWAPAGIMLAYYSEVKMRYVAGFTAATLPPVIQLATAKVMQAMANSPGLGNIKSFKAGDTSMSFTVASALDADTRQALRPFMARAYL